MLGTIVCNYHPSVEMISYKDVCTGRDSGVRTKASASLDYVHWLHVYNTLFSLHIIFSLLYITFSFFHITIQHLLTFYYLQWFCLKKLQHHIPSTLFILLFNTFVITYFSKINIFFLCPNKMKQVSIYRVWKMMNFDINFLYI